MAYANAHVKVTIFGTMAGGQEEWSTGFRMGSEDGGSGNFGVGAGFTDALLPLWQTFYTNIAHKIHNSFLTTGIKAAVILPDGKTDLANVVTASYATPIGGGNSGVPQARRSPSSRSWLQQARWDWVQKAGCTSPGQCCFGRLPPHRFL